MTLTTHVTILDNSQDNVFGVRLQGRLDHGDFQVLSAELRERGLAYGRLRVLLELKSIKNFTPLQLWDSLRTSSPEMESLDRLAVVCDSDEYQPWLAALSSSQGSGEVQYFEPSQLRAAWEWIRS